MIVAKNICKTYGNLQVLKNINISIERGKITAIVGASGAGKTTLLQILSTLDTPDKTNDFTLSLNGKALDKLSDKALSKFRNTNIGFIFQFHELLPEFTALENVCIPAWIAKKDKKTTEKKALELLKFLGVAHRAKHKPSELSGGEQQRIAVARALINDPKIIFADEPSGNLDSENAMQLHRFFIKLKKERGHTFVIVTHSEKMAAVADVKITMQDGKIKTTEKQKTDSNF